MTRENESAVVEIAKEAGFQVWRNEVSGQILINSSQGGPNITNELSCFFELVKLKTIEDIARHATDE